MKVIFMGTPDFACPTLEKLINQKNIEILAVYSKEPSISGRGKKITNSPIHKLALQHNLKVITPKTLKNVQVIEEFLQFKADVAIIVAYGLILPKEIINGPKFGCINLHPSLLPKYRGAAPIQRTIMNGDTKTATTIIKMDEGLDSGPILKQEIFVLDDKINYQELAEKFAQDGARLILQTLQDFQNNNIQLSKQDDSKATYAHKILKEEAKIDFNQTALEINQKIRGLSGNIGAYFMLKNERIKIFQAKIIDKVTKHENYSAILNEQFYIACGQGIIQPEILQKPGKKPMKLTEFLQGNIIIEENVH